MEISCPVPCCCAFCKSTLKFFTVDGEIFEPSEGPETLSIFFLPLPGLRPCAKVFPFPGFRPLPGFLPCANVFAIEVSVFDVLVLSFFFRFVDVLNLTEKEGNKSTDKQRTFESNVGTSELC